MFYIKRDKQVFIILILFAAFSLNNSVIKSSPKPTVFLLGIKSSLLNEIESRLLREKILRELQSRSFDIVPIMKFESRFRNMTEIQIIQNGRRDLEKYCEFFNADFAFFGKINPPDSGSGRIVSGKKYTIEIFVYKKKSDSLKKSVFETTGEKNYFLYFKTISKKIVAAFEKEVGKN